MPLPKHTRFENNTRGYATLWFDRPEKNNAFNSEVIRELNQHLSVIRVSPEGQEGLQAFLQKRKTSWQEL